MQKIIDILPIIVPLLMMVIISFCLGILAMEIKKEYTINKEKGLLRCFNTSYAANGTIITKTSEYIVFQESGTKRKVYFNFNNCVFWSL